ncbi:MAG: hypothetical protein JO180_08470 [Gemmatirosa sp.]|nr:hypothetical protein [Gemmatirosa sp.]
MDRVAPPERFVGRRHALDTLQRVWETPATERLIGMLLVAAFLGTLAVVELARHDVLPGAVGAVIPRNHFAAVGLAFTLLLIVETLSLVFSLSHSVADAVGKQFELLSVILLRKAFLAFGAFQEPMEWTRTAPVVAEALADMAGALLVFVVTGVFYRVQRHRPITAGEADQASFIAAKKTVALALLAAFALLGAHTAWAWSRGLTGGAGHPADVHGFFERFYTVLIFSDVLIVLVALCYSSSYRVVFRNSGFAAATLILRLALTAPPYINAALGVGAALFGVAVSLAYNAYAPPGGWIVAPAARDENAA